MIPSGRSIAPLQTVHGNTGSLTNAAAFTAQSVDAPTVPPIQQKYERIPGKSVVRLLCRAERKSTLLGSWLIRSTSKLMSPAKIAAYIYLVAPSRSLEIDPKA